MKMHTQKGSFCRASKGFTLIELMIAMVVLAVGLGAMTILFATAMNVNTKNSRDTTATMLAQSVMEQISSQPAWVPAGSTLSMNDCASPAVAHTIGTDGGAVGGAGTGAALDANGNIDWVNQTTSALTAAAPNYIMQYSACGIGGRQAVYEVRWHVTQLTQFSRSIVVSTREAKTNRIGDLRFAMPITVKGIGGV